MPAKQFCSSHGFAYSTFTNWMVKLQDEESLQKASFIRVEVENPIMSEVLQQQKETPDSRNKQSVKPVLSHLWRRGVKITPCPNF